ncbi:MAG: autoinducer binding domain-containing protein [Desulfobacteraceae bacterium]|jgi:DNA-binding CsgD family transcriptional regulator
MINLSQETIKDFTKNELTDLWQFAQKCLIARSSRKIKEIINSVRQFFSYDFAIGILVNVAETSNVTAIEVVNVSYPKEWINIYKEKSFHKVDPVAKMHLRLFKGQIWSQTYRQETRKNHEFIRLSNEFGLRDGVSHGIKEAISPHGSIFSFAGIKRDEMQRALLILDLIIPHMHIALKNYYREKNKQRLIEEKSLNTQLSNREKEVLNWLKIGKTNWEISMIMNISERTAKFHVDNIKQKLNSSTRGYAVAKAIQLELISL